MLEDGKNQRSEQSQSEAIHVSGRSNGFKRIDREELFRVLSPFGPSNDHIHILLARRTLSCYSFLHFWNFCHCHYIDRKAKQWLGIARSTQASSISSASPGNALRASCANCVAKYAHASSGTRWRASHSALASLNFCAFAACAQKLIRNWAWSEQGGPQALLKHNFLGFFL